MNFIQQIDWRTVDWVTPAIHIYAFAVLVLTITVYVVHQWRQRELGRRIGIIARQIEGDRYAAPPKVDINHLTGLLLHLGDVVERKVDLDLVPVLKFLRSEEQHRRIDVVATLVNLTETMIEMFPMLGIFGTVYGIAGVSKEDFGSDRLLFLFGVAVSTTLWALLYVIVFRIAYSALVQAKVNTLADNVERYQQFMATLEKRSTNFDLNRPAHDPAMTPRVMGR